jgi:hypothetical protein
VAYVSLEFILVLGYSISLALIALLLELAARHAHRRSLSISTSGFTYHPDKDIWKCPEFQHLFPVFVDHAKGTVIYRAPASACNACRSKPGCTDSASGREIERRNGSGLQYGMQRFHRAMSVTLLALASLILATEAFRVSDFYPRAVLMGLLLFFGVLAIRLLKELVQRQKSA